MAGPTATRVLGLLAAAGLIAVGLPLWRPLLLAAVLAGALSQIHERLVAALGGRRSLSATLVTVGVVLVLLIPLSFLVAVVIKETLSAIAFVKGALDRQEVPELIARLPDWLGRWVNETIGHESHTQGELASELARWPRVRQALGVAAGLVGSTTHLALMALLMLVAVFFLLRDGPTLIGWLERTPTMPSGRVRSLLLELRSVSKSVLGAQLGSGLAQAGVATIGFALVRVPDPMVFGVLSLAASFIPIGGVSLVGVPIAALLWLMGHPGRAIFLALWTVLLTGLIDNVLRPLLVRGKTKLNSGLVFFALLGGLLAFGPVGVVVGPLSLALFLSVDALQRRDAS
ncbi:MAG TPA: AI-2E family transporter [Polyangia bacterium]|nr:AI-2E family transporter [Polyangia bacterium]